MTMETDARQAVESPCIMSCVIDQNHGFCLGCWRTLREISDWHRYVPAQKHAVLAQIEARRATHPTI